MNRNSLIGWIVLGFVVGLLPGSAASAADKETRRIHQAYFAGNVDKIEIDVTLAALSVEGVAGGTQAEVEVLLRCARENDEKCRRRADRIRLAPRIRGSKLALRLKGTPRGQAGGIEAEMRVKIPNNVALEVDVGGGEVSIKGMRHHVEVDSGGGNIDFFGEQDLIGSFKVDVGFGKGTLWLRDGRIDASGWPRSIDWNGTGSARVEIDLGGGEIKARLD